MDNPKEETQTEQPQDEEKEQTGEQQETPAETQTDEQSQDKEEAKQEPEQVEEKLEEKGFNYKELEQEYFNNNGELTKETKEKLNKIGFSDDFINDFIEGKKAIYEQEINDLAQTVGGRDEYNSLIDWAGKNLEPETIQAVNEIRDKNILKMFILPVLKEKMEEKEGVLPSVRVKGTGQAITAEVFESQQEMFAAMRDPRYSKDPAYQAKVTAKIRASREAGINLGI